MKKLFGLLVTFIMIFTLAACGEPDELTCDEDPTQDKCNVEVSCDDDPTQDKCLIEEWGPDLDVEGEISILLWSGNDEYISDIGHKDLEPEELKGQNQAATYAVAKAFNEIYPNVKINILAHSGDPGGPSGWAQRLENFKTEYGQYPDIWASMDVIGEIQRGLIMDLSMFSDDPIYQSLNPAIMDMMNFYGFQAGLPQYLLPWGIYVNYSLAEEYNLDTPPVDWDIDEYTDFITSADQENFWGAMDVTTMYVNTGVTTINSSLTTYDGSTSWVDINSDEVKDLLSYLPLWSDYSVWAERDKVVIVNAGEESEYADDSASAIKDIEFYDDATGYYSGWGYGAFINNKLLTLGGDPWMMGDAAHPDPEYNNRVSFDWDIYPRPSTDYQGNTVGVVLDPMVSFNYCMLDENPECNDEEYAQALLTYKFMSFWVGDTRSWEARAEQMFYAEVDPETGIASLKTALNDSLPVVVGEEFDAQMEAWYSVGIHERFADETLMPGWHEVLDIWQRGDLWDVSDKSFLWWYDNEGTPTPIMDEWLNLWDVELVGSYRYEESWLDNLISKLGDWNTTINARFDDAVLSLQEGLKTYYNYTDDDLVGNFKPAE